MGKGVGIIKFWVAYIKKGMIIFEISYVSKKIAYLIFKVINLRFSLKVKFITREIYQVND